MILASIFFLQNLKGNKSWKQLENKGFEKTSRTKTPTANTCIEETRRCAEMLNTKGHYWNAVIIKGAKETCMS